MSATVLALLSAAGAHAQHLLTTDDGVSLRGTVRLLQGNAATCNVIAENEQGNYEARRVNQDQPLHLWELEFSVLNGSGRALDHLIAYYDIASPWPPCTNWTEQYDGLGYYQWVDPSGHIQHTGRSMPTLPNQTHTETIRVLAFNGVRPQFTDWSVNYTFLDAGTATAASTLDSPVRAANVSVRDAAPINQEQAISFGDDTSVWANDGECDDPRFEGPGTADTILEEDLLRDATDCRELFERGEIWLTEVGPTDGAPPISAGSNTSFGDFGDDRGPTAYDGKCDDSRFENIGASDDNIVFWEGGRYDGRDATDCADLLLQGLIAWRRDTAVARAAAELATSTVPEDRPQLAARAIPSQTSSPNASSVQSAANSQCEIPGFYEGVVMDEALLGSLRLSWCPLEFNGGSRRIFFALQAELARCRLHADPPPANMSEFMQTSRRTCESLAALDDGARTATGGFVIGDQAPAHYVRCRCPTHYFQ